MRGTNWVWPYCRCAADRHCARHGGATFHERGGPSDVTKGAKRVVAVDVIGLLVAGLVVPASTHENDANRVLLDHLDAQGVTGRLELVLLDRGMTAGAATTLGRRHGVEARRVGWDDKQPVFRPIRQETPPRQQPAGPKSSASPRRFGTSANRVHSPPACFGPRSRAPRSGRRVHADGGYLFD
jgi:hypothetical protein